MERKFLEELGVDKETVDKIMTEHGKSIEKQKQQIADERSAAKAQLDDVMAKLKAFDGVDVAALKAEAEKLKSDIAAKDAEHQRQIADRDFTALVSAEIAAAKGKNEKAIIANLELDKLKESKNQKEDIAAAIKTTRESCAYLFEDVDAAPATPAKVSSGGAHSDESGGGTASTNAQMNALITGQLRKGD